jgi:hypothetical protein
VAAFGVITVKVNQNFASFRIPPHRENLRRTELNASTDE